MRNRSFPKCIQERRDCWANNGGWCRILADTDFGCRVCPFYKPYENHLVFNPVETAVEIDKPKYGPIEIRNGFGVVFGGKKRS
jgi:hypothetical protein